MGFEWIEYSTTSSHSLAYSFFNLIINYIPYYRCLIIAQSTDRVGIIPYVNRSLGICLRQPDRLPASDIATDAGIIT